MSYRDYANARKLHRSGRGIHKVMLFVLFISGCMGATILIHPIAKGALHASFDRHGFDWIEGSILFLLPILQPALNTISYRRAFRRTNTGRRMKLTLDQEKLHCESSVSSGDMLWSAFRSCVESKDVFLLYLAPGKFLCIPKRIMNEAEIAEVRILFQEKIGRIGLSK